MIDEREYWDAKALLLRVLDGYLFNWGLGLRLFSDAHDPDSRSNRACRAVGVEPSIANKHLLTAACERVSDWQGFAPPSPHAPQGT